MAITVMRLAEPSMYSGVMYGAELKSGEESCSREGQAEQRAMQHTGRLPHTIKVYQGHSSILAGNNFMHLLSCTAGAGDSA